MQCKDEDARKFKGEWMTSEEGIKWEERKGSAHQQSSAGIADEEQ